MHTQQRKKKKYQYLPLLEPRLNVSSHRSSSSALASGNICESVGGGGSRRMVNVLALAGWVAIAS